MRFVLRQPSEAPPATPEKTRHPLRGAVRGIAVLAVLGGTAAYAGAQGAVLNPGAETSPSIAGVPTPTHAAANMAAALGVSLDGAASRSEERLAAPVILSVTADGSTTDVATRATTIAGLLAERGIELGADDWVSLPLETEISEGLEVVVKRVAYENVMQSSEIAFSTTKRTDYNLDPGQEVVERAGQVGTQSAVYRVKLVDGVEAGRELLVSSKVDPVSQVVRVGVSAPQSSAPSGIYTGSDPRAIARSMVAARGWSSGQFDCLNALWTKESNWNPYAQNPSSGAYGIPQALPGSKMGTVASDWRTNPATQITWGLNYIAGRYGTPCGAWSHSQVHNWY